MQDRWGRASDNRIVDLFKNAFKQIKKYLNISQSFCGTRINQHTDLFLTLLSLHSCHPRPSAAFSGPGILFLKTFALRRV